MRSSSKSNVLVLVVILALAGAPSGPAHAGTADEAQRQLDLAEDDLDAGNFERAAASASSAFRLDGSLHLALVVRGLALKSLGQLEDARSLLRVYLDLRGSLEPDPRVDPALADIRHALAGKTEPAPASVAEPVVAEPSLGRSLLIYGPSRGPQIAERAYAAARAFLGDEGAASIWPLGSVMPVRDSFVLVGFKLLPCTRASSSSTASISELLDAAEAALVEVSIEVARSRLEDAEQELSCGRQPFDPESFSQLFALLAGVAHVDGEPAKDLWSIVFRLRPDQAIDDSLPPSAQAAQLEGKQIAAESTSEVPLLVSSADLQALLLDENPPAWALDHLADQLAPSVEREKADGVLLVSLASGTSIVRRWDSGGGWRVMIAVERAASGLDAEVVVLATAPDAGQVILLGSGLAAAVIGVIVAGGAYREGSRTFEQMETTPGYVENHATYERQRAQQWFGAALAAGGGVAAGIGVLTFVLPEPGRSGREGRLAGRGER